MLNYWSFPFDDEILYSLVGRNLSYFQNGGIKQGLENFFGTTSISATLDLPSGLSFLSNQIEELGITVETLMYKHTLFPYYAQFLPKRKQQSIIKSMLSKSGDIHTLIGINAGIHPSLESPRFCKRCFDEDIDEGRSAYFRRAHQIPSIKICIKHNCYLHSASDHLYNLNKHKFTLPQLCILDEEKLFERKSNSSQIYRISEKLVMLLEGKYKPSFNGSNYFYNQKIKELGFNKGLSSLDIERLYNEWEKYYEKETLSHFNSEVSLENDSCWLKQIFRKHRKCFDPARHLLVENFVEHLQNNLKTAQTGVYNLNHVCRNPVCNYYSKNKHISVHQKYDPKSKRIILEVSCKCKFIYTQSHIKSKDKVFIRVKSHGDIWMQKLQGLILEGLSTRKISSILKSDSKTIKKILKSGYSEPQTKLLKGKQNKWLQLIKENPKSSITELRQLNTGLYIYLYRNSHSWLLKQDYPKKLRKPNNRVHWDRRDNQLVLKCEGKLSDFKSKSPEKRISESLLLKLIGVESMFRNNRNKLPLLDKFIKSNLETPHQHRLRRLSLAAKSLKEHGQEVSYWPLLRKANIRKEYITKSIHKLALHYTGERIIINYKNDKTA